MLPRRAFRVLLLRLDRLRQLLVSQLLGIVTFLGSYLLGPRFLERDQASERGSPQGNRGPVIPRRGLTATAIR